MSMPKQDIEFFEQQSSSILLQSIIPNWAKTTDPKQPIFRFVCNTEFKLIEGNFKSKSVSLGDKFKVTVRYCPVVRVDENILVGFNKPKPFVYKGYERGNVSIVTGITAWLKIQSAKLAIEPKDRLVLEVTTVFECINLYPFNIYKIVEQPVCMQFKF